MEALQGVFPHLSTAVLRAVLDMTGDVALATNLILSSDPDDIELSLRTAQEGAASNSLPPGVQLSQIGNPIGVEGDEDEDGGDGDEGEDGADDDDEDDDVNEDEGGEQPEAKRLRTVEPTPAEELANRKTRLVQFDDKLLRKTDLELLNLSPSRLVHTSVLLWSDEVADQSSAKATLEGPHIGWWIQHYPVSEVDHVWRVLVNSHASNAMGCALHLSAPSFCVDAGGEVEVRVLVKDVRELLELKRVGGGLLAVAPSSQQRNFVLFVRGALKQRDAGVRESKTKLEERSEYKLQKERVQVETSRRPAPPFGVAEPDRNVYVLYQVERSAPTKWQKVVIPS
uniref:CUE domain-containing protein n=1 Tax=Coccolithus braarudii TaxID=221442 RepID=A0A7S0PYP5_9EUKA